MCSRSTRPVAAGADERATIGATTGTNPACVHVAAQHRRGGHTVKPVLFLAHGPVIHFRSLQYLARDLSTNLDRLIVGDKALMVPSGIAWHGRQQLGLGFSTFDFRYDPGNLLRIEG